MPFGSIHVPASVVQRITRLLFWAMPSASVVLSSLALGYRWIGDRASNGDVATKLAPVTAVAREAQSVAFHCSSVLVQQGVAISGAWAHVVELHAELEVYRRYGNKDAHTRGELITEATRFFRAAFDNAIAHNPNDPAEAARTALLSCWRCGH